MISLGWVSTITLGLVSRISLGWGQQVGSGWVRVGSVQVGLVGSVQFRVSRISLGWVSRISLGFGQYIISLGWVSRISLGWGQYDGSGWVRVGLVQVGLVESVWFGLVKDQFRLGQQISLGLGQYMISLGGVSRISLCWVSRLN